MWVRVCNVYVWPPGAHSYMQDRLENCSQCSERDKHGPYLCWMDGFSLALSLSDSLSLLFSLSFALSLSLSVS